MQKRGAAATPGSVLPAARLAEDALYELDAPVRRVCAREVPVPYAEHMETASLPQVPDIVAAVRSVVKAG